MDQVPPGVTDDVIIEPLPGGGEIHYGRTYTMVILPLDDEREATGR